MPYGYRCVNGANGIFLTFSIVKLLLGFTFFLSDLSIKSNKSFINSFSLFGFGF